MTADSPEWKRLFSLIKSIPGGLSGFIEAVCGGVKLNGTFYNFFNMECFEMCILQTVRHLIH